MEEKNNKLAVYQVDGHEIKLSISIVRDCILKGDKTKVTNQECVNFVVHIIAKNLVANIRLFSVTKQ